MALLDAARRLANEDDIARDDAMGELLAARSDAVGPLLDVLREPGAAVGRIALLLSALGAREALGPLFALVEAGGLTSTERPFVARALAELVDATDASDDRRVRGLERLAGDDADARTRAFAATGLAAVGSPRAQERLRVLSGDRDPRVQKAALEGLVALKESGRLLTQAQKTPGPTLVPHLATSPAALPVEEGGLFIDLEKLVAAQSVAPEEEGFDFERMIADANHKASHGTAPDAAGPLRPWLEQLGAGRWADRNVAVEHLAKAGQQAVPFLIEKLAQPHVPTRMGAAMALSRIGAPAAAGALLMCATAPAATQEERELRPIALKALANSLTGAEEGLASALIPLARDPDRWVRAGALLCLGRIADRVGIRAAVVALADADDVVRESAAIAVSEGAREEDQDLVLPLLAILSGFPSPSAVVREAILVALCRIHVSDGPVRVRLRNRVRRLVLGQTASMRRMAVSLLEGCYEADDPPPVGIVDDVLSRLRDDHPEVRLLAASFVARHLEAGMTGAVEALKRAALGDEPALGLLCADALHRHDTEEAKAALEELAAEGDERVSARAAELLHGFVPGTALWSAIPEPAPPEQVAPPRPRRVRPSSGAEAVTAKFDDEG